MLAEVALPWCPPVSEFRAESARRGGIARTWNGLPGRVGQGWRLHEAILRTQARGFNSGNVYVARIPVGSRGSAAYHHASICTPNEAP